MSLLPRLRLALARRPWLYWLLVCVCGATVWLGLAAAHTRADRARTQWGTTRSVWVARTAIAAGDPLLATVHQYPSAMVPASALSSAPDDATAAHTIAAGEVLVAADLERGGALPADWLVFTVPGDRAPLLSAGDHVAVFGSGQQWCDGVVVGADAQASGGQVASGQASGWQVEVGVPVGCAAALSAQLALDAVTLARST